MYQRPVFVARRPQYGRLRFRDQQGLDTDKGVNVGDEWEYRSFIAGGTKAACIWLFTDITPEKYPDGFTWLGGMKIEAERTEYLTEEDVEAVSAEVARCGATCWTWV